MTSETTHRGRELTAAIVYVMLTAVAVGVIVVVVQTYSLLNTVRESQQTNTSTIQAAKSAAWEAERGTDRIEDCTTPGRKCYEQSQKRTADVVTDLNRVAVFAAACADKPGVQGEDEIYSCVIRLLAEEAEQ